MQTKIDLNIWGCFEAACNFIFALYSQTVAAQHFIWFVACRNACSSHTFFFIRRRIHFKSLLTNIQTNHSHSEIALRANSNQRRKKQNLKTIQFDLIGLCYRKCDFFDRRICKSVHFSVYLNRVDCGIDYGFGVFFLFHFLSLSVSRPIFDALRQIFIWFRICASVFTSIGIS